MFRLSRRREDLFLALRPHVRAIAIAVTLAGTALLIGVSLRHGLYAAAKEARPLASNTVRSARDFNWQLSPSSSLQSAGQNSVSLDSCPPGVIAAEPNYYVYISGTGTPEAVKITGGTCKGDGHAGTIEFKTTNAHLLGYTISSASSGIQEASIAARYVPTNPPGFSQSGKVVVSPGEYDVYAPISLRGGGQTIDFAGSILNCYTTDDPCIFVGDSKRSDLFDNITLLSPRGRPMIVGGTKPFIEVNAQQTRIFNVSLRWPPPGGSFGTYVQVDDDQGFLLDGLETAGGAGLTCNPSFCGAVVTAPGPFNRWSAVGWLKNLNISLQCAGKGVEWISGNSLRISDSVIQGWSVFGIRASNQRGGYAGLITDNVYFEASPSCKQHSPYGNVGSAAIIAEGLQVKIGGLAANSPSGVFPNWGADNGSHHWLYWVVPVHAKFGEGIPLPAGQAITNGSGTITGTFPKILGASSYKILKMDWDGNSIPRPFPEGTGNYLLTTIEQNSCATLTCSFTDSGGPLSSYSNRGDNLTADLYMPRLDFWPGAIVISPAGDMSTGTYSFPGLPLQIDVASVGGIVSTLPAWAITAEANMMEGSPATPPAAANVEALHTSALSFPFATILTSANLPQQGLSGRKGRLNFGHRGSASAFTPLITLGDSDWGKTWTTTGHRPPADLNDLDVGYEGNIDTLYSRAQKAIRSYIGKFPDAKPQEELDASAKTFNVPVTINGNLTVTGKCAGCASPDNSNGGRWSISLTAQKAAISSASLCGSSVCVSGQYKISYYLNSASTCGSAGKAAMSLVLGWKDETGTKSLHVPLSGSGVVSGSELSLGATANFGGGDVSVWSAANAGITYSTTYSPCSNGTGSYGLHIAVEKVQ